MNDEREPAYGVLYVIVPAFCLLALAVLSRSEFYDTYQSDIKLNFDYCHTDKNAREHQDTKDCQSFLYKATDDPVSLFTGGLFVFTIALALATIQLLRVTKRGITEQANLTRISLAHAQATAEAALKSASVAENALVNLERPYIFVSDVITPTQTIDDDGRDYYVSYSVANFGKIPAIINSVRVSVSFTHEGLVLSPPEIDEFHVLSNNMILEPGRKIENIKEFINKSMWNSENQVDQYEYLPVFSGQESAIFKIEIVYAGPFTNSHRTHGMWLYNNWAWVPRGEPEDNQVS